MATLDAVTVAMVVRGDTVEYDARAFRLAEGSMLDNLMSMLPGVSLTDDGRIYVNGEYVKKLLVNGRNFFEGNPKVALNNLPAYTIDKIRAYHERPEWAHLLDDKNTDNSKHPLVMDVRLKREYAQGWLANFEAAGGVKTRGSNDPVYLGRVFAMRYTDHSGLALYGSVNNLGDNQSPGRKGEWKKMDVTQGERTVKVGGANLSIDGKRTGTQFNSTIEARREDILSVSRTTDVSRAGSADLRWHSDYTQDAGQTDLKWNGDIKTAGKMFFLNVKPYASYMHNRQTTQSSTEQMTAIADEGTTADDGLWEETYSRFLTTRQRSDSWEAGTSVFSTVKSPLSGKNYTIMADLDYSGTDGTSAQSDQIVHPQYTGFSTEHRFDRLPKKKFYYNLHIERDLFGFRNANRAVSLSFIYSYDRLYEQGERTRELRYTDSDSLGLLASADTQEQWYIDYENSYNTTEITRKHYLVVSFYSWKKNRYNINAGFEARFNRRTIDDLRDRTPRRLERRDWTFVPSFSIDFLQHFSLGYSMRQELPSMLRLLDVRDADDPLSVYLGNPDLKRTTSHDFNFSYRFKREKRQITFNTTLAAKLTDNAVGQKWEYNTATGVTTYTPINIDGNRSFRLNANYGQSLDRNNRWYLSSATGASLVRSVDFNSLSGSDEARTVTNSYNLSEDIHLIFKTTAGINFGAKGRIAYAKYHRQPVAYTNDEKTEYSYGLTFSAPITQHLGAETDIMAYTRRGYSDESLNTTDIVWNASLSYSFGRQKEWLVRATGFDLLQQLSSTRTVVNEQGYTETWYNTVPSYVILSLTYRLNIKPKKERK